ncbi:tyrosinase family oxidase copper chaperone [Actinoplanes sp. NPDC023801]|uniref:tyrosinase family oxidase copper chaperone n=1 Tax=Actinoplanes sp. NPDC023801 TaxID=3154595 RepID=UPI0033F584CE
MTPSTVVNRRAVLRYSAATAAVASGFAGAQIMANPAAGADPRDFEIEYRGKRIRGVHVGAQEIQSLGRNRNRSHEVFINDRKLAVMEIELPAAGGGVTVGFISAINHYEPVLIDTGRNRTGLLKLTKRAVDVLGDTELTPMAGVAHEHGR